MKKNINNPTKGFTLIEVLVTMVITSIGLMGLISLQMQALQGANDASNRAQAIWLFNDITNRIKANQEFADSYVTPASGPCATAITKVCNDQNGSVAATCSGTELAAWDLFDVACGGGDTSIASHAVQHLPGANLTVSIANDKNLLVELTWKARTDEESITGAARTANSGELEITGQVPR